MSPTFATLLPLNNVIGSPSISVSTLTTGDYYHQDTNYTYLLTDRGNADWILTFVGNGEGDVDRVFIRKSCCSISRKIFNAGLEAAGPLIEKVLRH